MTAPAHSRAPRSKHARANANVRYQRALASVWEATTAAERAAGAAWYDVAQDAAADIAARYGLPLASVAGAMAALSPRTRWDENLADTELLVEWYAVDHESDALYGIDLVELRASMCAISMLQVEKAVSALGSDDPLGAGILRGPKERAFCANILGDPDAVTVDVWMTRAATRGARNAPSKWEYGAITSACQAVAKRAGVEPRIVQAAIWIHVRGGAT